MKTNYLCITLITLWLSSALAGKARGRTMVRVRKLESGHSYDSSDFEYISTLPSKKSSKKSSKKGKGGKSSPSKRDRNGSFSYDEDPSKHPSNEDPSKHTRNEDKDKHPGKYPDDKKPGDGGPSPAQPGPNPTYSPTQWPTTNVDEVEFGLDEFSLFYIPSGQAARLPTDLENSELLDLTSFYIDWFFKNEFPTSVRTDLLGVVTVYEGDNEFSGGQAIEKTFQSRAIFAETSDIPTKRELEAALDLAFNDQNINLYMEWLNGPYPPPPDNSFGELSDQNIFKGSTVLNEPPSQTRTAGIMSNMTGIMIAAAAVGFTLFVAGVVIFKRKRDDAVRLRDKDLTKRPEEATTTATSFTVAGEAYSLPTVSPLSFQGGGNARDTEREPMPRQHHESLLLPEWEEETIDENEDTFDEETVEEESVSADVSHNGGDVQRDQEAVSDWRRQRGHENDPIRVDSFESYDEQTVSDSSSSSDQSQRPKSIAELRSRLSSRLSSYNKTEVKEYEGNEEENEEEESEYEEEILEETEEDESSSSEVYKSNRPKSVKELREMLFAGGKDS
eukprot:scaffold351_cov120-Cylindrotheca_fusiformis.AAC.1